MPSATRPPLVRASLHACRPSDWRATLKARITLKQLYQQEAALLLGGEAAQGGGSGSDGEAA